MRASYSLPFTGREDELSLLHDLYMRTLHNDLQMAFIEGEPGVGKTTLLDRFLDDMRTDGVIILRAGAEPGVGGFASIFGSLLRSYLTAATSQGAGTSSLFDVHSAPSLLRLCPEIADVIPFAIDAQNLPESQEMDVIIDGLRVFLSRLSSRKPVAVALEDAHWMEQKVWEALAVLRRTLAPCPILVLVTQRTTEIEGETEKTFLSLTRARQTQRIRIDALKRAESRALLEGMFGADVADHIAGEIHNATGGNPLFIHETVNALIERSLLEYERERGEWRQTRDISGKLPAPHSASHIFDERLVNFDEREMETLRLAALLGMRFRTVWLKDLAGLPEDEFVSFLNRALKANVLLSDFQGELQFYHQLIQRYIEQNAPAPTRGLRRESVYQYFRTRRASHQSEGPFHRYLAVETLDPDTLKTRGHAIVDNNLAAARDAFASFSTALAVRYLEVAKEAVAGLIDMSANQRLADAYHIYMELGRVALESGRARQATVYYRLVAIFLAPHLELTIGERLHALRRLAEAYYKVAKYRRVKVYADAALALCEKHGAPEDAQTVAGELARIYFTAGLSLYNQGQYDNAIAAADEGLALLRSRNALEAPLELGGLRVKGIVLNRTGRHREAAEVFNRSLALAEETGDRREIGRAHYYLGVVCQYLGEYSDAMTSYRHSIAACREVDDLETVSKIYNNLGVHYHEAGDLEQAERNFRRALDLQTELGAVYTSLTSRLNLTGQWHLAGKTEQALAETRRIFEECVRINAVNLIPSIFDSQIEIYLMSGQIPEAEKALTEMGAWLDNAQAKFGRDQYQRLKGRIEFLRGQFDSGWKMLGETIAAYRAKGESFRVAQTMADAALLVAEALTQGQKAPPAIIKTCEEYLREAFAIYQKLNFTKRIELQKKMILRHEHSAPTLAAIALAATSRVDGEVVSQGRTLISVFGRLRVVAPGRHDEIEDSVWPSKKARALLAYLAVMTAPGRPVSRDKVCDALWSHLGPETILSSFHVTLSHLRKALQNDASPEHKDTEVVIHQDGAYNLAWGETLWVDIQEFDDLYHSGRAHLQDNRTHLALRDFEKARSLYVGALLEDLYDSWIEERREDFATKYVEMSQRLAEMSFEKKEFERAISLCQEALLTDPVEEVSHRLLMLTLYMTGRKAAAVKQYNSCLKALKDHLEIDPAQKTKHLAELIRSSAPELNDIQPSRARALFV